MDLREEIAQARKLARDEGRKRAARKVGIQNRDRALAAMYGLYTYPKRKKVS